MFWLRYSIYGSVMSLWNAAEAGLCITPSQSIGLLQSATNLLGKVSLYEVVEIL